MVGVVVLVVEPTGAGGVSGRWGGTGSVEAVRINRRLGDEDPYGMTTPSASLLPWGRCWWKRVEIWERKRVSLGFTRLNGVASCTLCWRHNLKRKPGTTHTSTLLHALAHNGERHLLHLLVGSAISCRLRVPPMDSHLVRKIALHLFGGIGVLYVLAGIFSFVRLVFSLFLLPGTSVRNPVVLLLSCGRRLISGIVEKVRSQGKLGCHHRCLGRYVS